MEDSGNLTDEKVVHEVANAINVIAADIIRGTPRLYPAGHPVHDMPRVATGIESALKRGNLADARQRAEIFQKYLEMYAPLEDEARVAKGILTQRMHVIASKTT